MPAELLLLLIVAFANPSCQVLSSLRMGEAPAPCSSETLPPGPSQELRQIAPKCSGPSFSSCGPRSPDTLPASLRSRSLGPFIPIPPSTLEATSPRPHSYPFSGPGTWPLPTPVSSQLQSWTTRPCVAVVSVWPWPWPEMYLSWSICWLSLSHILRAGSPAISATRDSFTLLSRQGAGLTLPNIASGEGQGQLSFFHR